jgi:hypothetical protein
MLPPTASPPPFCPGDLVLVKIPHVSKDPLGPYGRGHTLCFFPPQQESEWLDWKLGSTSPGSNAGTPQKSLLLKTHEVQYSCKTLEDIRLVFKKAPQDK